MSNFICPTCGMNNIDCGKQGYKTDREIELENRIEELEQQNAYECECNKQFVETQENLQLAIEALEVAEDALTDIWINDGIDLPKARLHIERVLEQLK